MGRPRRFPPAAARLARLAAVVLIALGGAAPMARAALEIGTAEIVIRNVYGGTLNRRLAPGDRLEFRETVRTGRASAAHLVLDDSTSVELGPGALLRLDEFVYDPEENASRGRMRFLRGALRFASSGVSMDLLIETPSVSLGIRGTEFALIADSSRTEVAVTEGAVELYLPGGTRLVRAGETFRVPRRGEPTAAPTASAELQEAVAEIARLLGRTVTDLVEPEKGVPAARAATSVRAEHRLVLELARGTVVIEMRPDLAPRHVERITALARTGFFDGRPFRNLKAGFLAEIGDPGGTGRALAGEFSAERFRRGAVGMTHPPDSPDDADSQFFICLDALPYLDGRYTYWGRVVEGMDLIDALAIEAAASAYVLHARVGAPAEP